MNTYIFSKSSLEISQFECQLRTNNISTCELLSVKPEGLTISSYAVVDDTLVIKCEGGTDGVTYNCQFQLATEQETVDSAQVVVLVSDEQFNAVANSAPDSFMDLVGTMRAGESTVSAVVFNVPQQMDISAGEVTWELLNNESEVISKGNAFTYDVDTTGLNNTVTAQCLIVCPSYVPPTTFDKRYQIRYTLNLDTCQYYQWETLRVESNVTIPLGSPDLVEMSGRKTTLSLVLPTFYQNVEVCIHSNNSPIVSTKKVNNPQKVASGWLYEACLNSSALPVSVDSYDVVWSFYNNDCEVFSESSKLWIINPSIRSVADDVLAKIQKARASLYGSPDLVFTMPTVLTWLRRGKDLFNGWQGVFTNFTMTNAKGIIREYWLLCSELGALEAQYMTEGEKAFNFSGAAIQLDVDRTGYLDSMIGAIRSYLDSNLKPIKQNMTQKGYTDGDGSGTDGNGGIQASSRALGTVGISITPASAWSRFGPYYLNGGNRIWL